MDFIERWAGISPDGGNGLWELAFAAGLALAALLAAVAAAQAFRSRRG